MFIVATARDRLWRNRENGENADENNPLIGCLRISPTDCLLIIKFNYSGSKAEQSDFVFFHLGVLFKRISVSLYE